MRMEDIFDGMIPVTALVLGASLAIALVMVVARETSGGSAKSASVCPHCGKEVRLAMP